MVALAGAGGVSPLPAPAVGRIDEGLVTEWRRSRRRPGLVELSACRRLRELAVEVPAGQAIVELGAHKGRSTGWLLVGAQDGYGAHVTSVDLWGRDAGVEYTADVRGFVEYVRQIGASDATLATRQASAIEVAADWHGPVGLLWHDAEHTADAVEADLAAWLPHLADDAVVALHDVCNPEMGVVEGARRVLGDEWDWPGELIPWRKHPGRRGLLILRRRG